MRDLYIESLIQEELLRQQNTIELIASENIVSKQVLEATGSILTNKYAEGKPYKRYYNGCDVIDKIEEVAQKRACKLFHMDHANVQPHSGAQANMAVFLACLNPGDTVLSMDLSNGGHLSHGSPVNFSGKYYNIVSYGINEDGCIDYDNVMELAMQYRPKLIICGASNYSKQIDFAAFGRIRDAIRNSGSECWLLADIAHIAGLVATGQHPSPSPHADFVTTTTHKSLRGPRGGIVMCKEEWSRIIDSTIFPGMQGGPLEHVIAAKAVCLYEAEQIEFWEYTKQVIKNAQTLNSTLRRYGLNIVGGQTENHLMTLDLRGTIWTGKDATNKLEEVGITANKNTVPNDPQSPFVTSGIRLGVCAVTTRGFKEEDMADVGAIIGKVLTESPDIMEMKKKVRALCDKYPIYEDLRKYDLV